MPGLCGKAFVWLCRSDDFIRSPLCVERKMGWLLSVSIDSFTECNGILCTIYLYNLVYFVIKRRVEKISHSNPSRFHFVCCETVFVVAATATPLHNTNKLETHISKVWFSRWTLHSRKWHDIDGRSAKKIIECMTAEKQKEEKEKTSRMSTVTSHQDQNVPCIQFERSRLRWTKKKSRRNSLSFHLPPKTKRATA